MKIILADCEECGFCNHGLRIMAKRNGIDWWDFLQNGIDAEILESWDDENARRVLAVAKARIEREKGIE